MLKAFVLIRGWSLSYTNSLWGLLPFYRNSTPTWISISLLLIQR